MMDTIWAYIFSNKSLFSALSWTLLHSLWQGLILSIVAAVIIVLTRKKKPLLRYNLLVASLLLFIVAVAFTFYKELETVKQIAESTNLQAQKLHLGKGSEIFVTHTEQPTLLIKAKNYINANAPWIVLTWIILLFLKFIRLSTGLYYMLQLRKRNIFSAGEYWNEKTSLLCQQLQIKKKVKLILSGIVTTPSVIGYLKPTILFPAAMLTSLSVSEVEAILIHELGHIRRNDFLVNLIQNMIETLLFYNPSVIWVSSLIKNERENCCDDIAVSNTNNKKAFIQALVKFQDFSLSVPNLTPAFAGKKKQLLNRIERMYYNKNKTLNNMEKKFITASLIIVSACLFVFASLNAQIKEQKNSTLQQPASIISKEKSNLEANGTQKTNLEYKIGGETNMTGETNTIIDGMKYRIVLENSVIMEMYIDGQKIPYDKIISYKSLLDEIYEPNILKRKKYLNDSEQSKRDSEQSKRDSEQSKKDSEQSKRDSEQSKRDSEQSKRDSEQSKRDSEQSKRDSEQSKKDSEQSRKDSQISVHESERSVKQSETKMSGMINELISDKIIKNRKELSSL